MKRKGDIETLRWVRLFTPIHIPKYLVEQVAQRDYEVNDLYTYLEINCLRSTQEGPTLNPLFHLWALVDPENHVKGFLWFTVDSLSKDIVIQVYSVDTNFWGCKGAVLKLAEHIKDIRKKACLNKIYWITKFPKHSFKYGFKPSKSVLMEYTEEEENGTNVEGRIDPRSEHKPSESGTTKLSDQHPGGGGTASGSGV